MKNYLTLILIMLLTLLTSVPAAASEKEYCGFKDAGDAVWYADAVRFVSDNELMVGTGSEEFGPDATLTRAQFVTILWRMAGEPGKTSVSAGNDRTLASPSGGGVTEGDGEGVSAFSDVEAGSWYEAAVNWSAEKGLVTGYGNGRFGPAGSSSGTAAAASWGSTNSEPDGAILPSMPSGAVTMPRP